MNILCLTKNFRTQTPSGGYDQLARYIASRVVNRPLISSFPLRVAEKAWNYAFGDKPHLFSGLGHGYHFQDRLCEERAFWWAAIHRPELIHVLYGDWALDALLRRRRWLVCELVSTFHLPAESVTERFERAQKQDLENLGGAVLLSSKDLPAFSNWLGRKKVMYVPHGIDLDVFYPIKFSPRKVARFLFVGMMLRDFEIAHRVIDRCRHEQVPAEFIIVIPAIGRNFFTGCANTKIVSNVSERELIAFYHSSDALFLPLINSTANNAILEALACGTPVISTHVGGVPDYVDQTCGWLLPPGDEGAAFECVRAVVREREIALQKRGAARRKAELFSWPRVAQELTEAYDRLRRTGQFAPDPGESHSNLPKPAV